MLLYITFTLSHIEYSLGLHLSRTDLETVVTYCFHHSVRTKLKHSVLGLYSVIFAFIILPSFLSIFTRCQILYCQVVGISQLSIHNHLFTLLNSDQQNPDSNKNLLIFESGIVLSKISTFLFNCQIVSSHKTQSCSWASSIERICSFVKSISSHVIFLYCSFIRSLTSPIIFNSFCSFISFKMLSIFVLFWRAWSSVIQYSVDFQLKYHRGLSVSSFTVLLPPSTLCSMTHSHSFPIVGIPHSPAFLSFISASV